MDVAGFSRYEVSTFGHLIDRNTGVAPRVTVRKGCRYYYMKSDDGVWKLLALNRLVYGSFYDGNFDGFRIVHLDGDPSNYMLWNLDSVPIENPTSMRILNVTTGEIYESVTVAGRKLGYSTTLHVPENAKDGRAIFVRKNVQLQVLV